MLRNGQIRRITYSYNLGVHASSIHHGRQKENLKKAMAVRTDTSGNLSGRASWSIITVGTTATRYSYSSADYARRARDQKSGLSGRGVGKGKRQKEKKWPLLRGTGEGNESSVVKGKGGNV